MFRNKRRFATRRQTRANTDQSDPAGNTGIDAVITQALSDADQTAANLDQLAQDADSAAALADQLGSDADQLAADRDQLSADAERESADSTNLEDENYFAARQQRMDSALVRESSSRLRLQAALTRATEPSARDRAAADRDFTASERDRISMRRDEEAGTAERARLRLVVDSDAELAEQLATNEEIRRRAAGDRARAADDRLRAARDRIGAADDRHQALIDLQRALLDGLTGAFMRDLGLITLEHELERSGRSGKNFVLAFVDVDGLKQINDNAGHAAGDALLKSVVETLKGQLRSYDPVVRLGGDEFLCGLVDTDIEIASSRAREMQEAVRESCPNGSITIGLAQLEVGEPLEALIARADEDMYAHRQARH